MGQDNPNSPIGQTQIKKLFDQAAGQKGQHFHLERYLTKLMKGNVVVLSEGLTFKFKHIHNL
jgi:hypothetical protein